MVPPTDYTCIIYLKDKNKNKKKPQKSYPPEYQFLPRVLLGLSLFCFVFFVSASCQTTTEGCTPGHTVLNWFKSWGRRHRSVFIRWLLYLVVVKALILRIKGPCQPHPTEIRSIIKAALSLQYRPKILTVK